MFKIKKGFCHTGAGRSVSSIKDETNKRTWIPGQARYDNTETMIQFSSSV